MIDEIFDRQYQAGRAQLNASLFDGLGNVGRALFQSFRVLNRIEYQAPWSPPEKCARCN